MKCPKCEGEEKVKNGFKNGVQRYKRVLTYRLIGINSTKIYTSDTEK